MAMHYRDSERLLGSAIPVLIIHPSQPRFVDRPDPAPRRTTWFNARMSKSTQIVLVLLLTTAFAVTSLASGAGFLGAPLPGGLPLGNALAALGLCAAAGAAIGLGRAGTMRRAVAIVALLAAGAWLPVSVVLAGNLALNFSGGRGQAWMAISLATVLLVAISLAWALVAALLSVCRRRRTADA